MIPQLWSHRKGIALPASMAIDTEFMWRTTYYPKPALVQMASRDAAWTLDPLPQENASYADDLDHLAAALEAPECLKLFFAAHDDLVVLHLMTGRVPTSFVDIQYSAFFCGTHQQMGLERMLQGELGITLDKTLQGSDWLKRPLTAGQLAYAVSDVAYLHALWDQQVPILQSRGAIDWLEEDMEALTLKIGTWPDPWKAWRHIPPQSSVPRSMALLQALAAWRETYAQTTDVPASHVAHNDTLARLAAAPPSDPAAWKKALEGQNHSYRLRFSDETFEVLMGYIADGMALPLDDAPVWPHERAEDTCDKSLRAVRKVVNTTATELDIPSFILGTRRDIESLASGRPSRLQQGWRWAVLAPVLQPLGYEAASLEGPS